MFVGLNYFLGINRMPKHYTRKMRRRGGGLIRMNAKRNVMKKNNTIKTVPSYTILKNRYHSLIENNPGFPSIPNIPISPIVVPDINLQERFNRLAKMKGQ